MDRGAEKALGDELRRLQEELVKLQQWVRDSSVRLVIVVEGRDAAGKGGVIKRITGPLNPRWCRVVALPAPSDREHTQWYFQRYAEHLPAGGEIVIFDRSWYNRAGVERVMGFCSDEEVQRFFRQCPAFERMLLDDGIILVKYWFSVSDAEQERRFQERATDPMKRWKLSRIDIEGRALWNEYSMARDDMFAHCDTPDSPWWVVEADEKLPARVNCIAHLLSVVPYRSVPIPRSSSGAVPPRPLTTSGPRPVGDTTSPTMPRPSPARPVDRDRTDRTSRAFRQGMSGRNTRGPSHESDDDRPGPGDQAARRLSLPPGRIVSCPTHRSLTPQ